MVSPLARVSLAIEELAKVRGLTVEELTNEITAMDPSDAALELSRVDFTVPEGTERLRCLASKMDHGSYLRVDINTVPRRYLSAFLAVCKDVGEFRNAVSNAGIGDWNLESSTIPLEASQRMVLDYMMLLGEDDPDEVVVEEETASEEEPETFVES